MRCSLLTSDLNRFKNRILADTVCGKGGGEEGTEGGRGGGRGGGTRGEGVRDKCGGNEGGESKHFTL